MTEPIEYHKAEVQQEVFELVNRVRSTRFISDDERLVQFWLRDFLAHARNQSLNISTEDTFADELRTVSPAR